MTGLTCIATHVKSGTNSEEVDYFRSVGTPISNMELRIVDEDGRDVSHVPDVRGEICVRGPAVTKRYFENEKANMETLTMRDMLEAEILDTWITRHGCGTL
jgi:4-coumarate--CoA ligase